MGEGFSLPNAAQKVLGSGIWMFWVPKRLISGVPTRCCPEGPGLRIFEVLGLQTSDFRSPHQMLVRRCGAADFGGFGSQTSDFRSPHQMLPRRSGAPDCGGFGFPKPLISGVPTRCWPEGPGLRILEVLGPQTSDFRSPHQILPRRSGAPDFGGFGSPNL